MNRRIIERPLVDRNVSVINKFKRAKRVSFHGLFSSVSTQTKGENKGSFWSDEGVAKRRRERMDDPTEVIFKRGVKRVKSRVSSKRN